MAQFIHVSLLLATIQLSSVKVTVAQCVSGEAKCECLSCESTCSRHNEDKEPSRHTVIINNHILEDNGKLCYDDSYAHNNQCLKIDFTKSDLHNADFTRSKKKHDVSTAECWNFCTEDPTCQYFIFHIRNRKCFLISSSDNVVARCNTDTASEWYTIRNCKSNINDAGPNPISALLTYHDKGDAGLRFCKEEKSWFGALEHCCGMKSSLVEITNHTVENAVKSLLQNKTDLREGVWIGLERSIFGKRDRPWMWISGKKVEVGAPQWSSLVDPLNHHCGKIIWVEKSKEFKLLDGDCHDELPFICQSPTHRNYKSPFTVPFDIHFH